MSAFNHCHVDIKSILTQARNQARSAVNAAMVEAYWLIDPNTSSFCSPKKN
ncbi:hypothetical protein A264_28082 [Pseudomonas syringae pv. actinidiae ICMP 19071]|jgi:hypothetical protein|uniref:hypothetical protein n=1 Tax=Pseudomonas syringae TaxID=317 RepID=UPI000357CD4B|nr:hypothetical protein [Pseudomonas syringae]EPM53160.1 hypothetical protein A264_28082 [Pseudomonas syringae pv. actinidiae ICMP 19071]EPM73794.1 hypothetical protein A3SO_28025 [Pseudomonas syringae pv. actinidiae ICMP 19072]OSN61787.1 hypothetical protein BV349_04903 [Pseudomonas syringae pv. actinidiae]OSN69270.1 hypothetical protein BV351_05304 [Pseudomonas syringae pv. actinidiae]RMS17045.1 hypothetical protein ALP75_200754 [Pseudomonas syringae pv. actinidiae]